MGDKITRDRTAELLPRENMMSTSWGTKLTARIFFPAPHTCCVNFWLCLSPMSCLFREKGTQDVDSLPFV